MMRRKTARRLLGMLFGSVIANAAGAQTQASPEAQSLTTFYQRAVRDSNGDGLPDQIVARIVTPANAALEDVEAATNISARLGYETTAASLPITVREDRIRTLAELELPILVGRENHFVQHLAAAGQIDLRSLHPGEGLLALAQEPDGRSVIVVAGADDAGTLAASVELSARLPRLWSMTGVKLDAAESQVNAFLASRGVAGARVAVTSIVVDAARRGLASVGIDVVVPPGEEQLAAQAFEALDREHRFGRGLDALNFVEAATTAMMIRSGAHVAQEVVVHRVGISWRALTPLPPAPPPPSSEGLAAAASADSVSRPGSPVFRCLGCPVYRVDGMITGGGGGGYSPPNPTDPAPVKPFDLAEAYSINGWFGDRYRDLIPDSTETNIIVGGNPAEAMTAANIGARLGLETTGITLPIARRDGDITQPANERGPILVGRENLLVQALVAARKAKLADLTAGEGSIQIVPRAFGTATATVVAGADEEGTSAASLELAQRVPYLWDTHPGSPTLQDLKANVSDFFAGRTGAGEAAQAVGQLSVILGELKRMGASAENVRIKLYLDQTDPALAPYLKRYTEQQIGGRNASVDVETASTPLNVFNDRVQIPWEGQEFWARLKADVLPHVVRGDSVEIEARLSENPTVRAQIARQAQTILEKAGVARARVEVGSAYKQGFFWLTETVLPALKVLHATAVHIKVRAQEPDYAEHLQSYEHPARWIKELYPADMIFKRDLGLPADSFVIEQVDDQASVYTLEATGADGKVIYTSSFDPSVVRRSFLDIAPDRAKVEVETGHLSARINGKTVVSDRIETDLERVWDLYQRQILPKLRDYLVAAKAASHGEQPPAFRDLRIEGLLSEPDYEFGVEGQHISSPEGLAQDLAAVTNAYLRASGAPMPARVIPIIVARAGLPGELKLSLSASAAPAPRLEVAYTIPGTPGPVHITKDLMPIDASNPQVTRIIASRGSLRQIDIQVTAQSGDAALAASDALAALATLHQAGIFRTDLSYDHVGSLALSLKAPQLDRTVSVPNTGVSAPTPVHTSRVKPSGELVPWDHVINSAESEQIIGKLAYYPSVSAYRKARSYEGRDISVLEITEPSAGALVSVAKIAAYKPTALFVGRQHGSEPSSTSFILRLAERLASDPAYHDIVRKVNVVLLPIMNPDGAALAAEIREVRPIDVASPGYLSALGQDLTVSTTMPESVVDPYLWRRWLPDIYLNAHGAASHEVVLPFSGYVSPQAPTYDFRRGWYLLAFRVPADPRYPKWEEAALNLRGAIAREIDADPTARSRNLEDYREFAFWGHSFSPHLEQFELYHDVMLFYTDPGSGEILGIRRLADPAPEAAEANRTAWIGDWPRLTLDAGTIEAADEGAQGDLLDLAARDGFAASVSILKYLRDGNHDLKRIEEEAPGDGATLTTLRLRPVLPR